MLCPVLVIIVGKPAIHHSNGSNGSCPLMKVDKTHLRKKWSLEQNNNVHCVTAVERSACRWIIKAVIRISSAASSEHAPWGRWRRTELSWWVDWAGSRQRCPGPARLAHVLYWTPARNDPWPRRDRCARWKREERRRMRSTELWMYFSFGPYRPFWAPHPGGLAGQPARHASITVTRARPDGQFIWYYYYTGPWETRVK